MARAPVVREDSLEFGVLGPLAVRRQGEVVGVSGRKPRALLAYLLLHANELVPRDRLIEALLGAELPDLQGVHGVVR